MNGIIYDIEYLNHHLEISAKYREGAGGLIIFIHGLGCSKDSFEDVWKYDGFNKYSLIALDLAGFGESSKPEDFSYTIEDHADLCKIVLDNFPGRKVHITGHSMGGAIGLLLADKIGERLASFFNVEGNLFRTDCGVSRKAAAAADFKKFKESLFIHLNYFTPLKKERGPGLWAKWLENSSPIAFNKSADSLVRWTDSGELFKKFMELKCPKAYISGDKNSQRKIFQMLTGINLIAIRKSGHFPMNDNPDEFYKSLYEFLEDH